MAKWSILIATLARRSGQFHQLLDVLRPQMRDGVEVIAFRNHGERRLGDIRQSLVENAAGEYVSFIDDDDTVPPFYVDRILPLLDRGVDYVGWRMQAYINGQPLKPTYHTLDVDHWFETDAAYWRDISHLNPVRRALALQADFRRATPPEDVSWSDQMRPLVTSQEWAGEDVMYEYRHTPHDSTWQPGHEPAWDGHSDAIPSQDLPTEGDWFRWHPEST